MLMGEPPRLPAWVVALVAVAAAAAAPATPEETLGAHAARFVASLAAADRAALDERIARKRSLAAVPGLLPALPDHFVASDRRRLEDAAPPCGAWEHCPYDGYYMPLRTRVVADGSSVFVEYATYFCYNGYLSWCSQWYGGRRDDAGRFETCSDASDTFSGSSTWTVLLRDVEVAATYVDANGATSYALRVREAEHGFVERGDDRFAAEGDTEWNSAFGYIENMNALEFDDWAAAYDDEDGDEGEDRRLEDGELTYALVGDRVTWYEAAAVCDKAGGRLAGVDGDDAVGAVEAFLEARSARGGGASTRTASRRRGTARTAGSTSPTTAPATAAGLRAPRAMDADEVAWIVDEDCGGDVRLWCDDDVLWYEDCWSGDSAALGNPFCGGCDGGGDDDNEWDDDDGDIWGAWVGFRQGESGGLVDVAGDAIGDDVWEADDDWTAGECGLWDRDGYFEVEPCEYGLAAVCEFDEDVFSYSYAWIEGVDVTTDEACAYSPSCTCACETCADFLEGRCGTDCAVDEAEEVYVYCQCADHDHCTAENWRKFLPADPSYYVLRVAADGDDACPLLPEDHARVEAGDSQLRREGCAVPFGDGCEDGRCDSELSKLDDGAESCYDRGLEIEAAVLGMGEPYSSPAVFAELPRVDVAAVDRAAKASSRSPWPGSPRARGLGAPPGRRRHDCALDRWTYGDATETTGAWADLVGVAGAGGCYEAGAAWSAVAVAAGDAAVDDDASCAALCDATDGCDVWERGLFSFDECCELKAARGAGCGPGLRRRRDDAGLRRRGAPGRGAPAATLDLGTAGWWGGAALATTADDDMAAADCRAFCVATAGCGGWRLKRGACLAYDDVGCAPSWPHRHYAPDETVSGVPGCVSEDDLETSSWFDECDSPRCTEPEGAGSYVGDTFRPASGCYAVVEQPAVVDCLEGTWFLVNGGSNALTFFKWLADQVSPDLVSMGDTFESEVIDVVFGAGGDVEYVFKGSLCSFGPVNCNYGGSLSPDAWDSRHRTSVAAALAAPAYVAGGTRITLVVAQFYDQTSMALEGVAGATAWAGLVLRAAIGVVVLEIRDAFARDVDAVLAVAEPVCARANAHCFFAPAAYNTRASGGGLPEILKPKVDATAWAHLIDWTGLVTDWIPEEIVDGHTTPFPHITAYNMIWNTVCGGLPAAGCPEYLVADDLCFDATNGETGDWVMASEVDYCTYARVDAVPVSVKLQAPATVAGAAGLADCLWNALGLGETGGASGSSSAKELCKQKNRLFCGGDGWALAGAGFGVAAALARGGRLGGARYVASVHIVLGHLFAKGAVDDVYLYGWGYTWVPFFFMLSGYVLAHSRLASRDPSKVERPTTYLAKRLATVYPAYAVGLFLALGVRVARGVALPETKWMLYQAFLLQAFDRATEQVFQFHSAGQGFHCWFLSCLVPYWLLFGPVYAKVRNASLEACFAALVVLSLIPWLLVLVPELADEDNEWYRRHAVGDTSSATDLWVVFLKFHPLCYFHVFLYGVVLARLRANLKAGADGPLARFLGAVARGSATAGFGGLLLVFLARDLRPAAHKLSCRLPLQAMILVGLSPIDAGRAADPVAAAFAKLPAFFGDISYPQYVLQFVAYSCWPTVDVDVVPFLLYLTGGSALEIVVVVRGRRGNGTNATVWLAAEALDVRLNWTSSTRGALINPSLLLVDGDIVRRRAHSLRSERGEGAYRVPGESFVRIVVEETASWSSDIVLAAEPYGGNLSAPFDEWRLWDLDGDLATGTPASLSRPSLLSHLGDGAAWGALCEPVAAFYEANNTVVRKVAARPGDGACVVRHETSFSPLAAVAGDVAVRGSATAAPYGGNYLALLHTLKDGAYETLAYEGAALWDHARVAAHRAPGRRRGVPSALLYAQGKVVLAYGVDDASSRALVMSAAYLEELFVQDDAWCNATAR
ncbi:hypothetical protein JL722_4514 [Aureococcus anophagefferens]|nr:hypothetical protein JL722_4514 [Aureococcus anophagefferens]